MTKQLVVAGSYKQFLDYVRERGLSRDGAEYVSPGSAGRQLRGLDHGSREVVIYGTAFEDRRDLGEVYDIAAQRGFEIIRVRT